jgi:hypothetical protein
MCYALIARKIRHKGEEGKKVRKSTTLSSRDKTCILFSPQFRVSRTVGGYTRPTNILPREREGSGSDTTASFGFVTPQVMKPGSSVEVSTSGTRVYKKKNNC